MSRSVAIALVLANALALVACSSARQPWCPYKGLAAGDRQVDAVQHLVALPSPSAEDLELPSLDGLSDLGRLALKVVQEARYFTSAAISDGGELPVDVEAWRVLFREKDGGAAFRYLASSTMSPRPGKLFGLCRLWFTDRAAFEEEVAALKEGYSDAALPTFFGCIVSEETPLLDVLPEIEDGTFPRMFRGDG